MIYTDSMSSKSRTYNKITKPRCATYSKANVDKRKATKQSVSIVDRVCAIDKCHGTLDEVHLANGERGIEQSWDIDDEDLPSQTPDASQRQGVPSLLMA